MVAASQAGGSDRSPLAPCAGDCGDSHNAPRRNRAANSTTSTLQSSHGTAAATQNELLNFAGGGFGQLRNEREMSRDLKVCQMRSGELNQFRFGNRHTRLRHHEGVRRLTPHRIGKAHDRHLKHRWMSQQHAFDLHRGDVFTAADDDVSSGGRESPRTHRDGPPRHHWCESNHRGSPGRSLQGRGNSLSSPRSHGR